MSFSSSLGVLITIEARCPRESTPGGDSCHQVVALINSYTYGDMAMFSPRVEANLELYLGP